MRSFISFHTELTENDARIQAIQAKYASQISATVVQNLANDIDPTRAKMYLEWLVRQYIKFPTFDEDLSRTREDLVTFERVKTRLPAEHRDINRIKDYRELGDILQPYTESKSGKQAKREHAQKMRNDTTYVYCGPEGMIVIPRTQEAASFWGLGTRWCTTSEGGSYFQHYSKQGPLYVLLFPGGKKWQAHFPTRQVNTETDAPAKNPNVPLVCRAAEAELSRLSDASFGSSLSRVTISQEAFRIATTYDVKLSPDQETLFAHDHSTALAYVAKTRRRFPAAEKLLAQLSSTAFRYASLINQPFPEGERAIATNLLYARAYAKQILKGPFHYNGQLIAEQLAESWGNWSSLPHSIRDWLADQRVLAVSVDSHVEPVEFASIHDLEKFLESHRNGLVAIPYGKHQNHAYYMYAEIEGQSFNHPREVDDDEEPSDHTYFITRDSERSYSNRYANLPAFKSLSSKDKKISGYFITFSPSIRARMHRRAIANTPQDHLDHLNYPPSLIHSHDVQKNQWRYERAGATPVATIDGFRAAATVNGRLGLLADKMKANMIAKIRNADLTPITNPFPHTDTFGYPDRKIPKGPTLGASGDLSAYKRAVMTPEPRTTLQIVRNHLQKVKALEKKLK